MWVQAAIASLCSAGWALSPHTRSNKPGLEGLFTKHKRKSWKELTAREGYKKEGLSYSNSGENALDTPLKEGNSGFYVFALNTKENKTKVRKKCSVFYQPVSTHLFSGSFSPPRLQCLLTSWSGTCLRLKRGRSFGIWSFTAFSSQCRRLVPHFEPMFFFCFFFICFLSTDVNLSNVVVSYICSASMCHIQPSPCSSAGTRKSGTLLQPTVRHHPVQINWFHWCFVIRVLTVSSCVCSQGWWWRCWAQCWALQSRGR